MGIVVFGMMLFMRNPVFPEAQWLNTLVAVAILLIYKPVLSAYLCTLGKAVAWLRIREFQSIKPVSPGKSYQRFVAKCTANVLGAMPIQLI